MTPFPKVADPIIPSEFNNDELAALNARLLELDAAVKQADSWAADADGKMAAAGDAFFAAVSADYADARAATSATSKAEKALSDAKRDLILLQNIASYRRSLAESAAAAVQAKRDELTAAALSAAAGRWARDKDSVRDHFRALVVESFRATPTPFQSLDSPAVGADLLAAYDAALRGLAAARDKIKAAAGRRANSLGVSLDDLTAENPKAIVLRAYQNGELARQADGAVA